MIDLKDISVLYGDIPVLTNIHLTISKGDFVSVTGPSGSGKTTLLNIIAGLLMPTNGKVFINNISLYELSQAERVTFRKNNFGFIFQSFNLIPYLTATENVQISLYLAGIKPKHHNDLAQEYLHKVNLVNKAKRLPSQLSVGEQQRVAIARALAHNPEIILADEPTGNLDKKCGTEIMEYLMEINQGGSTVIFVTHDLTLAEITNSKIEIVDGRIAV